MKSLKCRMKALNWNNQKCDFEVYNKKSINCKLRSINWNRTQNRKQQRTIYWNT